MHMVEVMPNPAAAGHPLILVPSRPLCVWPLNRQSGWWCVMACCRCDKCHLRIIGWKPVDPMIGSCDSTNDSGTGYNPGNFLGPWLWEIGAPSRVVSPVATVG